MTRILWLLELAAVALLIGERYRDWSERQRYRRYLG